ncbi:MAG: acyl-ACP--UDP-N-acetylglucosamine O-acyltransferase [Nitrospirae bacterium]|nr:acyl-ACP--UDP-N-acetylglucosamine O-acyltransferase [Nitrospirota bacterium]
MKSTIHKTAIIDSKAKIDLDVEIGPYCIVKKGVQISKGTKLLSHVVIEGNTVISENCTFFPFSSIGLPPQDLKYRGEPTKLIIGNDNVMREYVTIHRASVGGDETTVVGSNNYFMAYVHIAHNCRVGNHNILANAATLAGHVVVEDFTIIGGLAAVHQFTRIGRYAMIGGLSGVVQDVPPYMVAAGSRAKLFGPNTIGLKRHGFSDRAITAVKKTYKILFREKRSLKDAIRKVREDFAEFPEIGHLIEFIEKNKRGICR